jgi:anhydro-N-acetylmuramic acid kinase
VDEARLKSLLAHPYFALPAPKSLDRLTFSGLIAQATEGLRPADAAATLAAFSSAAIAGVKLPAEPKRVLVAGGGRHNPVLMAGLAAHFTAPVQPVEAAGWDGDALEAQCFAFLAVRSLRGLPLSLPSTTGVPTPMPGGRVQEWLE